MGGSSSSPSFSCASPATRLTFLQRLAQKKQLLGSWALATSCLLLSLRLMDQKREMEQLKRQESDTICSLRDENVKLKETLSNVKEVLAGEESKEGSRLPALTRLEIALRENGSKDKIPETLVLEVVPVVTDPRAMGWVSELWAAYVSCELREQAVGCTRCVQAATNMTIPAAADRHIMLREHFPGCVKCLRAA